MIIGLSNENNNLSVNETSTVKDNIVSFDDTSGKILSQLPGVKGNILVHSGKSWVKISSGAIGTILTSNGPLTIPTWEVPVSGGVSDGDKGDITVSIGGTVWTIDNLAVTNAKINDVDASKVTQSSLYRFVTDTDLINLSNLSGVNTGDQTSIVGISGLKSDFNTACTDGDFLFVGDVLGLTDGNKGDITVSLSGTQWDINSSVVQESNLLLSDITTYNVDNTKHGFVPKATDNELHYLRADGLWSRLYPVDFFNHHYFTGRYYGLENNAIVINSNLSTSANLMLGAFFITPVELEIDRIGIQNNATATSDGKIFIYKDDFETTGNYLPSILEYEGTAISFASDTLFKENTISYTFLPGKVYWIGVIVSATVTLRRLVAGGSMSLGSSTGAGSPDNNLQYSHSYASPLPSVLTQSSLSINSQNPPNVRFRAV